MRNLFTTFFKRVLVSQSWTGTDIPVKGMMVHAHRNRYLLVEPV